ncbi:MAG: hypothetical protein N2517_03635 [Ignavibacteria bacterium]|nr:hypothetical protein [Ignavibacteria bacterium]
MKSALLFLLFIFYLILVSSCGTFHTRTETETYTIVVRDTLTQIEVKNAPGRRDLGVVYPSSKVIHSSREITTRDSIVERFYPNFIRLGVFESVGLVGTSSVDQLGMGLFGMFAEVDPYPSGQRGYKNKLFSGGYYRFFVGEWRLRWFRDSKNWTIGTSVFEIFAKDNIYENTLGGFFPLYIKKRFFISENIPYLAFSPSFGIGLYPSQYVNLNTALELGSLGGLNLRLYAGVVLGMNPSYSFFLQRLHEKKSRTSTVPYLGLGISFLDFVNIVPELYTEWKDHEHSSWNIGILQMAFLRANKSENVDGSGSSENNLFRGLHFQFFPTKLSIPILNNQFYLGTSALTYFVFDDIKDMAIAVLPFRLGFWQVLIPDELSLEPYIEYGYYPSTFLHIGNRFNFKISESLSLSLLLGYLSGNNKRFQNVASRDFFDFTPYLNVNRYFVGISIGIIDRIFQPEEIRYNKGRSRQ